MLPFYIEKFTRTADIQKEYAQLADECINNNKDNAIIYVNVSLAQREAFHSDSGIRKMFYEFRKSLDSYDKNKFIIIEFCSDKTRTIETLCNDFGFRQVYHEKDYLFVENILSV